MFSQVLTVGLFVLMYSQSTQSQNIICIMTHCATESKNCYQDADCKAAMECIIGCGTGTTNQTCLFDCLYSYEDPVFDTFMKCVVTDHKCITMVSPDPNFRCKPPSLPLKKLPPSQLKGSWYIVLGLNPLYDCFDCQITTYMPTNITNTLNVSERFDVHTIDGKLKHRVVNETAIQKSTDFQGLLEYSSLQMGHETSTEWRIIYQDPQFLYMIGYYCGHVADDWYYEGAVVYSKMPTLSAATMTEVKGHMTTLGLPVEKFCAPKTSSCTSL